MRLSTMSSQGFVENMPLHRLKITAGAQAKLLTFILKDFARQIRGFMHVSYYAFWILQVKPAGSFLDRSWL